MEVRYGHVSLCSLRQRVDRRLPSGVQRGANEQARLGSPELRGRGIAPAGRLPDLDGLRLRPQTCSQQAAGNVPTTIQVYFLRLSNDRKNTGANP